MSKLKLSILLVLIGFSVGLFYFAYNREWIIVRVPCTSGGLPIDRVSTVASQKKVVTLYYWSNQQWNHESAELLWPNRIEEQLTILINRLLSIIEEEKIIEKKITVQSVMLTHHQSEALISFDRNFLCKENSTYTNLMIVESLLKTIRDNDIKIHALYFLVHHCPLNDNHLDFSKPWPVTGFVDIN